MNNESMKFSLRMYLILAGMLLLSAAMLLTHTQFFQQFSHNKELGEQLKERSSAAAAAPNASGFPICLIYDGREKYSVRVKDQAVKVLRDIRKPTISVDLRGEQPELADCAAAVTTMTDLTLIDDPDALFDYVGQGGRLFLATMPERNDPFVRFYRKLGIIDLGEFVEEPGIRLTDEVLLGEKNFHIDDNVMENTVMQVELDSSARVHATTASGTPMLWSYDVDKGSVMVFNGTILEEKTSRGMIVGAISMMIPDFIYPIYNSKLMYIDDWPAPYGNSVDPDIYKVYRMNRHEFFKQVWWPDMLKAAKRYNLKYTAVMIESYNDRVQPPFANPPDADSEGLISYGREIIKSGGEIGLHGYNHQSLTTSSKISKRFGYKVWASADDMALSVEEALNHFKQSFPNYSLFTYVPPSNVLSTEGREALKKEWSSFSVISSIFAEDPTGAGYVQEFGQAEDGIIEMPRVTSGYADDEFERWMAANTLTSYGFFSHFVHPDDVLDSERSSGLNWEGLYSEYATIVSRLQEKYPWLEAKTSVEAALDMKNMLSADLELKQSGKLIEGKLTPLEGKASFILRTRKKVGSTEGCDVTRIGDGIMLVVVDRPEFTIHLSEA
ncbi:DUF2194 domain-containing protein [Saccharibacillus sp. CPCC 101409]|uniref:DUF2194 domain-containing protein n=1 Tax=Saccharibacillus sp. CPCC 101409 TaxID=3058041 RepID=UPI0026730828|nr:DUF2194 domain-containing protein [Saccharibacillus sp. CPCC 101409]MDO3411581.1 DUF2194 domain-containing protein [Saccharibacillus sp. CPCC 101409]